MKKLAEVPYDIGKSFDFYEDRLVVEGRTIDYVDINGYSYLLTHKSNSINFIPISNSTSFTIYLSLVDELFKFGRQASGVMAFKSKKQATTDLIFSELHKCLEVFIAPFVFTQCLEILNETGELKIGKLNITETRLIRKTAFGLKELPMSDYKNTIVHQGIVKVYGPKNKMFFSCSLSEINAPLVAPILNALMDKE